MGYEALRKGRFSEINRAYFVTTVTLDRKALFTDLKLARIVINVMKQLDRDGYVHSLSWMLMPDHLHWLFQLGNGFKRGSNKFEPTLSAAMKRLKAVSAQKVNLYLNRRGSIWQKAYYDHGVRDGEDIKQLSRYIVANPLRAGLIDDIGDYPHWDSAWL